MYKLALVAVAGGLGALSRYGLSGLVHRFYPGHFPLGTAFVNILGCLLFGFFWSIAENRLNVSTEIRLIVLTGFMGAFTTFSTYMFETGALLQDAEWQPALINLLGQNVLGLAALLIGLRIGQLL